MWCDRTLGGQQRGYSQEYPPGARMAVKVYSDHEAVRSIGDRTWHPQFIRLVIVLSRRAAKLLPENILTTPL